MASMEHMRRLVGVKSEVPLRHASVQFLVLEVVAQSVGLKRKVYGSLCDRDFQWTSVSRSDSVLLNEGIWEMWPASMAHVYRGGPSLDSNAIGNAIEFAIVKLGSHRKDYFASCL